MIQKGTRISARVTQVKHPVPRSDTAGSLAKAARRGWVRQPYNLHTKGTARISPTSRFRRQGLIRHLQRVCEEKLTQRGEDPVFRFWKGWAIDMEGMLLACDARQLASFLICGPPIFRFSLFYNRFSQIFLKC